MEKKEKKKTTEKATPKIVKGVKTVCEAAILFIVAEGSYVASKVTLNDVKDGYKYIRQQINPKVPMKRKKSILGKREDDEVLIKKGVWVSDGQPLSKREQKVLEKNNQKG